MSTEGALKGRKTLVTGSGTGIGREIALEFARQGSDVVLHYAKVQVRSRQLKRYDPWDGAPVSFRRISRTSMRCSRWRRRPLSSSGGSAVL